MNFPQSARQVPGIAVAQSFERPVRVLHAVGHLNRGGIENWILQVAKHSDPARVAHDVMVRTEREEPFTQEFRDAGIGVIPCLGVNSPLRFFENFRRGIGEFGPFDVLHVHGVSFFSTLALVCARLLGIRTRVLHAHNDLRPRLAHAGRLYRLYTAGNLRSLRMLATQGLACSSMAAEWTFGNRWQSRKPPIDLVIGIDMERCFQPPDPSLREKLGIPSDRFIVAQIGRFTTAKNHAFTVRIAEELARRDFPFHILLIGDGEKRPEVEKLIQTAGLADRFTFLRDSNDVPNILRSVVDLQVLPSIHEGLGLVLLEAQGCGVPSLVSETVTRESVVEPRLCRFLPIDRGPGAWADAIIDTLEREPEIENEAQHREQMLASRFNVQQNAVSMTQLYALALVAK